MLTRLEIDGFKTFEEFGVDLAPFTVILGPNAAGKSNLFDAIQLLANLASTDLRSAVQSLRGDVGELFRITGRGRAAQRLSFGVEVLVDPVVRDPWGKPQHVSHTRIRYELVIARQRDERGLERLVVERESAMPILSMNDRWRPFGLALSVEFRRRHLRFGRKKAWLETEVEGDMTVFKLHQDGHAGRMRPGVAPEATVLSSITTAEFPHLFALREEMKSWRLLQLDPAALRRPSPVVGPKQLLPDGSNLAAVLARIKAETASPEQPAGALADIAAEVARIIPGVMGVDSHEDSHAREYRAEVKLGDGLPLPTRVVSDGTLRVLALLTLLSDPEHRGLVCFEEPENGVHPARLRRLIERLGSLVSDIRTEDPAEGALVQLLLNSHSPVVLSALAEVARAGGGIQIYLAELAAVTDPEDKAVRRRTSLRPIEGGDNGELFVRRGDKLSHFEVKRYLETVEHGA